MVRPLRPSERRFLLALSDGASATTAVVLAMWTWSLTAGVPFSPAFARFEGLWFLAVPIWVIALAPTRHSSTSLDPRATIPGMLHACGALFVAYLIAFFYAGPYALPRLIAMYILWDAFWLTLGGRLLLLWTFTRAPFTRRMLVVGEGRLADAALALMHEPGLRDVVMLSPAASAPDSASTPEKGIDAIAIELGATDIVVAFDRPLGPPALDQLLRCQELGVNVSTFERLYEETLQRVPVRHVGHDWMLTQLFSGPGAQAQSPITKRLFDVAVALLLGLVGAVPALLASIAVLIESGRPVFYSQWREGRGGRVFRLTKFRTMGRDAESEGPQWSPENDPRITRVGRVLRRTHLDELPNLWAVLRGDMSIVGPRPERPEFVELLEREVPLYRARLIVPPGLTGWAQVNTEYGDSVDDATTKLEYDLYYARHRSFWFDLSVLVRTVGRILGWKGR